MTNTKGMAALEAAINERFTKYKDGLISKGELLGSLSRCVAYEADKYADELENNITEAKREMDHVNDVAL